MKYLPVVLVFPLVFLGACRQTDPEPDISVDEKKNSAFVNVNGRRSNIFFGGEGIRVDTPSSRINIRGAENRASD